MAIGIPLLILSGGYHVYICWRYKKLPHLASFFLIVIPLSTFIIFDIRHDHILIKNAIRHIQEGNHTISFGTLVWDRLYSMTTGIEFLRSGTAKGNFALFVVLITYVLIEIRRRHHALIYVSFLYFFIGFYALSLINAYPLLYFYTFPMFPLAFIMFASIASSKYKNIGIILFFIVYGINLFSINQHVRIYTQNQKISDESWLTYHEVAQALYQQADNEFGYFIYTPDTLAYGAKYAVMYQSRQSKKKTYSFKKMPVTYVVIAPPPKNNPLMSANWWKQEKLHLTKNPDKVLNFASGYTIERYTLTPEEIAVPADSQIDPGIFFR
jgi:hypothetical protein